MDDNHRKETIVFVLVFCIYLMMMGGWASERSRAISLQSKEPAKRISMAASGTESLTLSDFLKPPERIDSPAVARIDGHAIRSRKAGDVFHPIIEDAANRYEVDPALIKAIIWAESSFDPNAVSDRGALGLMQLMPSTARSMGVKDCFNPENNIHGGVRYFKQLMTQFDGNARLALAAYNAGSQKVMEHQGVPPYKSTQFFVNKVFRYYQAIKKDFPAGMDKL